MMRLMHKLIFSVLLWDSFLTILTFWTVFYSSQPSWMLFSNNLTLMILIFCIWTTVFLLLTPQRVLFTGRLLEIIGSLLRTLLTAGLVLATMLYVLALPVPLKMFWQFIALNSLVLLIFHLLVYTYIQFRRPVGQRRILIVGSDPTAQAIMREITHQSWADIYLVGYLGEHLPAQQIDDAQWLGSIDNTLQIATEQHISEIIFLLEDEQFITAIAEQLQQRAITLHGLPAFRELVFSRTSETNMSSVPLNRPHESVLTGSQRLLKWLFDTLVSLLLLMLFIPVLLLIALAIKLDSAGPVFFVQERFGEYGRRFNILKFRTMHINAAHHWQEIATRGHDGVILHKIPNDPRVTRVGQVLRRTSLDELPQLINILRSEMSLVGPRPEVPYIVAEYQSWQWERFRVLPGITGWWQVNGRSSRPMHQNTEDDLYYIRNYSFWLDLKILCKTIMAVVRKRGAF
jgi:exopolysaccharide biosynthesis polyprenyl glycosylphosphotransferase